MSTITQRQLSNETGKVLDELCHTGRTFVTRHGVPVAVLLPVDEDALYDHLIANVPDYVQAMAEVDNRIDQGEALGGMSGEQLEAELGIND